MTSIGYFADFVPSRTQISIQLRHFTAIKHFDYAVGKINNKQLSCVFYVHTYNIYCNLSHIANRSIFSQLTMINTHCA